MVYHSHSRRAHNRNARQTSHQDHAALMALEPRLFLCADHPAVPVPEADVLTAMPALRAPAVAPAAPSSSGPMAAGVPLSSVPILHSNAAASAKLYLDFTGDTTSAWESFKPGTTPAYDQDGDPATFSSGELASIRQIWARVAETYSPFNVDVTTVNPGNLNDRQTARVVFGGTGAWYGATVGGISYVGGFSNSLPNTAFVFTQNLASGDPHYSAVAAEHEAGHLFGLQHQSVWSGSALVDEYNHGTAQSAPVMGYNYDGTRALWWKGTNDTSATAIQDDLSTIAASANGFGYRPDDRGNSISTATHLTLSSNAFSSAGVIGQTSDADYYSFTTNGGAVRITANPAAQGGMLNLKLQLRRKDGSMVQSADTATLGETVSATLPAGTYYVMVGSHGSYGDVGQYTLSGSVGATATAAAKPAVKVARRAHSAKAKHAAIHHKAASSAPSKAQLAAAELPHAPVHASLFDAAAPDWSASA